MTMLAAVPLVYSAVKSYVDEQNAESEDAAMRRAAAAKLSAMRQGAGQMEQYRQGLTPQMMQAMQNRMAQYGGAQNVLSQMYGGHPAPQTGRLMPPGSLPGNGAGIGGRTLLGQMAHPGPAINPGTPGGARASANPYFGEQFAPRMGFGGEMPMPADMLRRKV